MKKIKNLIVLLFLFVKLVSCSNNSTAIKTKTLPVVNRTLQVSLLTVILFLAILFNGSVIWNISKDSLKLRMVHFLLIRHVCITDLLGAIFVLPVPLIAIARGAWDFGDDYCRAVSTSTAALWTMHLVAVALYRADRVFAVWLPTGKYPIISTRYTHLLLITIWFVVILMCYLATITFGHTFQPALALCIPNVPLIFFILVFSGYCTGLLLLTTGYLLAFARRRKRKKKKRTRNPNQITQILSNNDNTAGDQPAHRRTMSEDLPRTVTTIPNHRRVHSESVVVVDPNISSCGSSSKHSSDFLADYNQLSDKSNNSTSCSSTTNNQPEPPNLPSSININTTPNDDDPPNHNPNLEDKDPSDENTEEEPEEEQPGIITSSSDNANHIPKPKNSKKEFLKKLKPSHLKKSKGASRRAIVSYSVSVGHLILYLPAMLVVGLKGSVLPAGIALFCGLIVYCEFIVQPVALLVVSPRLREEVCAAIRFKSS